MSTLNRRDQTAVEGFSLIEILVSLIILGAVFFLAVPMFRAITEPTPTKLAREILNEMRLARLTALKSGRATELVINVGEGFISTTAHPREIKLPRDMIISATVGRDDRTTVRSGAIVFLPNGGSTGGVVRIGRSGAEDVVLSVNWLTGISTLTEMVVDGRR